MNLEHKNKNLKYGKRKTIISDTKEPQGRGGQLALYLVLWLARCLFKIGFLEPDAPLKWMF